MGIRTKESSGGEEREALTLLGADFELGRALFKVVQGCGEFQVVRYQSWGDDSGDLGESETRNMETTRDPWTLKDSGRAECPDLPESWGRSKL